MRGVVVNIKYYTRTAREQVRHLRSKDQVPYGALCAHHANITRMSCFVLYVMYERTVWPRSVAVDHEDEDLEPQSTSRGGST